MPNNQFEITPLNITDIPALLALDAQVFTGSETETKCIWSEKKWRKVIENSEFTFGLRLIDTVTKNSTLIGNLVVNLEVSKTDPITKQYVFCTLAVAPLHQRQGHAVRLLTAFKDAFLAKYDLSAFAYTFRLTVSQNKPHFKFMLANSSSYKMSIKNPERYVFVMDGSKVLGLISQAERKLAEKIAASKEPVVKTVKPVSDHKTPLLSSSNPQGKSDNTKLRCVIS